MNTAWLCSVGLVCLYKIAVAQVPETGRWQELSFSSEEVHSQTEDRYVDIVVELAANGKLDDDRPLLARLKSISSGLIRAALDMKPESKEWKWEIHTTNDPKVDAFCMAGGKILVGSAFVHRLALDDAELATLIAHEMAHAVAEHHREELSEALHISPQPAMPLDVMMERLNTDLSMQIRLAGLSNLQEREADQIGMVLAHHAGWPAAGMVSFYKKLAAIEEASVLGGSHPEASSRVSMAKGMALLFAH